MSERQVKDGLYKNAGSRCWRYKFKHQGKIYEGSTGCESFSDAKIWLREFRRRDSMAKVGIKEEIAPTLELALRDYITAHTGVVTQKYLDQKESRIQAHFVPELKRPINQLDQVVLEAARQRYLEGEWAGNGYSEKRKGRSIGGWNHLLRDLKAVLGWAKDRKLISEIPFAMTTTKNQERVKPVIWPEDAKRFLAQVDAIGSQDVCTAIRLMLYLGLREDEALGARWEWFSKRTMTYRTGDSKNRKVRVIPIPKSLLDYVEKHHTREVTGLIIPAADGQAHREQYTDGTIRAAARKVGVVGLHPHRMRATFASTHFEMGTSIGQIQVMMGHESQSTTMGYVVTRPADLAQAQEKFAALIEGRVCKGLAQGKTKKAETPTKPRKINQLPAAS